MIGWEARQHWTASTGWEARRYWPRHARPPRLAGLLTAAGVAVLVCAVFVTIAT